MSKSAHKNSTWRNDVNCKPCPKKGCHGKLIHCTVRYKPRGPIHEELECSDCSLVKKDVRYKLKTRNKFFQKK